MTEKQTYPFRQRGHLFGEGIEEMDVFHIDGGRDLILGESQIGYSCAWCGARKDFAVIGGIVQPSTDCRYPDGITTVNVLAVPSGRIVVDDALDAFSYVRDKTEEEDGGRSVLGQAQEIDGLARDGCAYGPVGNSCPALYRTGDGTYVIAALRYDKKLQDLDLPEGWTHLASITTDTWAYSIADHDDYVSRGGTFSELHGPAVVDMPAGKYEFTHHTGAKSFDWDAPRPTVFADVKFIGS